jgi:Holliday junction resolvase RusA-like endonuclease
MTRILAIDPGPVESGEFNFTLPIAPVAKGRPRFGNGRTYTPAETLRFERQLVQLARRYAPKVPLTGPLGLWLVFTVKKPKRTKNATPCVRPDLDNYCKAVMDALNGLFWKDDAQVVSIIAGKEYGDPEIRIGVWALETKEGK